MHEATRVDGGDALTDVRSEAPELVRGVPTLRLLPADMRMQGLPGDVLHHEDGAVPGGREVVHAADVRVRDRAREDQLLTERLVVAGHARVFADDLQRNRLLGRAVVREEDLTHAALSEALANFVPVVDDGPVRDRRGRAALRLGHWTSGCDRDVFTPFSACL